MSNFELIDDYLTNRLGEQEKLEFEQQLGSDPGLKAEVDAQKHLVEGIRSARISELKAMLNNVPVGSLSAGLSAGKIAVGVVATGIIGTALYLYLQSPRVESGSVKTTTAQQATLPVSKDSTTVSNLKPAGEQPAAVEVQKEKRKTSKPIASIKTTPAKQPKIEVVDPSDELVNNTSGEVNSSGGKNSTVTLSHIAVETDATNKKYNFHYQFKEGKLALYGAFDKSLYEIIEIHGDSHAVFLYYKENYYLLSEKQTKITPLQPIKDVALLKKLKEYRGR